MNRRLPPCAGQWVDHGKPVQFQFEGKAYGGLTGDVLSTALWANDVRTLGRSFKYHRPRGIYSLAGHDSNVLVEDRQRTNLRGDLLRIEDGLDVRAVNTLGGLSRDWLRFSDWFSRLMPVGFYYKAFHTPGQLFPFYENQLRQIAGLGKVNSDTRCEATPKDYAFCELLVVGAGPAGLAAALTAAEQGVQVLLVDDQRHAGGSLAWQWRGDPSAAALLAEFNRRHAELEHLQVRLGTTAAAWYEDHWIALVDDRRLTKLRAQATLVATGCYEQPAVFQNNDLPGVMLGSAAQRLIHLYAVKPFDRAVVLAANRDGYRVAHDLHAAGVHVVAVVDPRPQGESTQLARDLADAGIEIRQGQAVAEAVGARRNMRIRGAVICPLDDQGELRKEQVSLLECDGIAVSVGWAPTASLLYQARGQLRYDPEVQQFVPQELPEGLLAAGRVNGIFDLEAQIEDGRRAGLQAAAWCTGRDGQVLAADSRRKGEPAPSHPYPIYAHPGKKNFVDFDEDLHLADFRCAHQEGYDNIELIKRYTTVGMGPSQGKLSNMNAVRILARLNSASIDETGTTTSRPFHQPVPLGHLAGRRFHPLRRTPIHDWHVQAGAQMVHAGGWLRPEFYAAGDKHREDYILDEARNVRQNVGLIDVGTLGKLHISGPDATALLEHIYTGRFAKQPVGRLRYALACDETAVVIEDGVVARLAEDHYYVTATSSGVAAFYREMQRWALIFGMRVWMVNATGQMAAMNIAGPHCRAVLQELTTVDLQSDAFPYLGVREGQVAGVPAILLRVGFVGELGYELHVPASGGHHVWMALVQSGRSAGIQPFGVEAQRLLRLEKGHFIVGHDTDALTNPHEANVDWAIGKNKRFFVGSRSLDILRQKPLSRRLVGLRWEQADRDRPPKECHLIISQGEIVGRVTSIALQSTLGHPIALAFVRPTMSQEGTKVQIRVDDGSLVQAKVTPLPFYDPANTRQT